MRLALVLPLTLLFACAHAARPLPGRETFPPSLSRQLVTQEEWIALRHGLLLEMMRRHGVAMLIVVNEEFHADPLAAYLVTPRPLAGNRDLFVFADAGPAGLKKFALTGYPEESLLRLFESPEEPSGQKEQLQSIVRRLDPKNIALSIDPAAPSRGVSRSLTRASYQFLAEALGSALEQRFVPAAPLFEELLDTRLPEERETYLAMVKVTEELTRRALSREVIEPGRTTVGEIRRWLYDQLGARGFGTWFEPDLRVQRRGLASDTSRGFLAVAKEAVVIERGDLVHLDFGLTLFGLNTDWQKMAYVLLPGESDVPAGIKAALANTEALQDAMVQGARPGRLAAEVYDEAAAAMQARSAAEALRGASPLEAQIYSHPLGAQGHGLGAAIDSRAASRKEPPKTLRKGSYLAVELSTKTSVPEWGGQGVSLMEEDPAELTDQGFKFFVPRQTELYLIH